MSYYEPHPRYLHAGVLVENKWFNYGGKIQCEYENNFDVSKLEEYDPAVQRWTTHETTGEPPLGYIGSAASSIGSKLYIFGGRGEKQCYNTVHELDVNELEWRLLKPENEDGVCPIPKYGAGMISFDNRLLVTYGGIGSSPASYKEHALYVGDRRSSVESVWTNELLCFDINKSKHAGIKTLSILVYFCACPMIALIRVLFWRNLNSQFSHSMHVATYTRVNKRMCLLAV